MRLQAMPVCAASSNFGSNNPSVIRGNPVVGRRIAAFEAAIAHAASRPDSDSARLQSVMSAAARPCRKLRGIQSEIQAARSAADARIGREVDELNAALGEVHGSSTQIVAERAAGRARLALFDQRQAIVDRIAMIVPLREAARDRYHRLFTTGGAVLLDGRPAAIKLFPAGQITPDMTLGSGALSALTVNGQPVLFDGKPARWAAAALGRRLRCVTTSAPTGRRRSTPWHAIWSNGSICGGFRPAPRGSPGF